MFSFDFDSKDIISIGIRSYALWPISREIRREMMELRFDNGRSHDLLEHSIVFILKLLAGSAVTTYFCDAPPKQIQNPNHSNRSKKQHSMTSTANWAR